MKKASFLFFFLSIICINSFAQFGYQIEIKTSNLAGHTAFIGYYASSSNFIKTFDSVQIKDNNQPIFFKQTKSLIETIYAFYIDNKKNKTNIVAGNGSLIKAEITNDTASNLHFLNSPISTELNLAFLPNITRDEKLKRLENLEIKYPKSVVYIYAKLEHARMQKGLVQNAEKIRNSFFDGVDLKDKRVTILPNLFTSLNAYNNIVPVNDSNYRKNADLILQKLDTSQKLYSIVLDWYFKNIELNEDKNLEETFVYLFEKYTPTPAMLGIQEFTTINTKYNLYKKLPNGSKIPDVSFQDSTKKSIKLSDIYSTKPFTLIAFFDPDCQHCQERMPVLARFLANKDSVAKVSILNVAFEKYWNDFLVKSKMETWQNLKSDDPKRDYMMAFQCYTNPNFFLVNKDGIIISKSGDVKILNELIK